jgi:hypothetical protein
MGMPNNDLIPAAILFRNPGITRHEFVELLNRTRSTSWREYGDEDPWNSYGQKDSIADWGEDEHFHWGLIGLAESILRLKHSEDYERYLTPSRYENRLPKPAKALLVHPWKKDEIWMPPAYDVISAESFFGKTEVTAGFSFERLEEGGIWYEPMCGGEYVVERILEEQINMQEEDDIDEELGEESGPTFDYSLIATPIHTITETHRYGTLDSLVMHHPMFNPDYMFDWSKEEGELLTSPFDRGKYLWLQRDGKYYLDPKTYDQIHAGWHHGETGYTDIVRTSEAIRLGAWKLLTYRGFQFNEAFERDHPQAHDVLNRATWDAQTSIFAKKNAMTHTEFLRWRLEVYVRNLMQ